MARQERAERTRQTIIRAAAREFEVEGYAAASLADITARARVTKGALYFHFASKRELAVAVATEAERAVDGLVAQVTKRRDAELPLQLLIDLTHALLRRVATDPVLRAGLRLGSDPDLYPEPGAGLRVDWSGLIESLLPDRCAASTTWPAKVAPLGSVLAGLELVSRKDPSRLRPEVVTAVWEMLLPGLVLAPDPSVYRPGGSGAVLEDRVR
ncbi:MAG TPA: ScbR family autoregulator-binding transcription factor [Actinocrinis sp.]|nr:ScbR family autoregulator-binding transcription factor [Actinocrinis sp.]